MDATEELAETTSPGNPLRQHTLADSCVEVNEAPRRVVGCPGAVIRCQATRSSASSPTATEYPCTGSTREPDAPHPEATRTHGHSALGAVGRLGIPGRRAGEAQPDRLLPITRALWVRRVTVFGFGNHHRRPFRMIGRFILEMGHPRYLSHVLRALKSIEGISQDLHQRELAVSAADLAAGTTGGDPP